MGTEVSHQRSPVTPYDEGMAQTCRNNYRPLRFHKVHGDNVKLSKNDAVATRAEGFCKAIVFSDRPVMVDERVHVKFVGISSNWSGSLRIGFTMNDPMSMKTRLPRYACPDLTTIDGNWAKAILEKMARQDAVLHYYADRNGDVHYGIDKQEYGVFFGGVETKGKLWAVLDIYGNTISVELVNPLCLNASESTNETDFYSVSNNTRFLSISAPPSTVPDENNSSLFFHSVHGKSVLLHGTHARRTMANDTHPAYIFTHRPVKFNEIVVVEVIQASFTGTGDLTYGITSCDPQSLLHSDFPYNPDDLVDRPEYWIVKRDEHSYKVGESICYSMNSDGEVRVKRTTDSTCSTFYVDPTQQLWLFLNIGGSIMEVKIKSVVSSAVIDIDGTIKDFNNLRVSMPTNNVQAEGEASGQQSTTECVICLEEVNCALYRCGHMCMCYECAMKMWNNGTSPKHCPICRGVIKDVIKIYR